MDEIGVRPTPGFGIGKLPKSNYSFIIQGLLEF